MRELATVKTLFGIAVSERPRVVVVGAPLELSSGCREGGGNGPAAVREASRVLEAYSPALDRDLSEVELNDAGDLELPNELDDAIERIEAAVDEIAALQRLPVLIGGEHTVSLGAVRALRRRQPDLVLLQVDAHTDLREEFEGEVVSRATWIPHSGIDLDHVVQVGIRSTGAEVGRGALHDTLYSSSALDAPLEQLQGRPVYLTVDIDVLDPAVAPGVLCPEPGGVSFAELLDFVYTLDSLQVVGFDVVEVVPDHDPAGLAALAAAKLLRELILLVA
jgi:agmatinase